MRIVMLKTELSTQKSPSKHATSKKYIQKGLHNLPYSCPKDQRGNNGEKYFPLYESHRGRKRKRILKDPS